MTALPSLTKGERVAGWTLGAFLGRGLNGEVWQARNVHDRPVALKLPLSIDVTSYAYARLQREADANRRLAGRPGLVPFIDAYLPDVPTDDELPWLAMERAEPLHVHLRGASADRVVAAMAEVCETLAGLAADRVFYVGHQVNASVATIGQGANLYDYKGRAVIGDLETTAFVSAYFPDSYARTLEVLIAAETVRSLRLLLEACVPPDQVLGRTVPELPADSLSGLATTMQEWLEL